MKRIDVTKRIMIYISVLCAAIILMPVVVGADDIASATPVSIGDLNCPADGTITAPIMLSGIQNYGTGKINITYNPAMVHVTGVASSSDSTVITHNKNNSAGITSIAAWNTAGVSGDIVFANVTFTAVGTGSTSLNLDVSKLADTSTQLIPLTISNGSIGIESLQPSTPFLTQGYVYYENGSECNDPTVNLTNLDTGGEWTAVTIEISNYYQIMLGIADIVAGETLQFNVTSPDGSQSVTTEHTVSADEVNDGGLFNYNIMLVALNMPPVADPNGPYTGAEGTEIAFDGSASSDPDGSIVSYDWDFGDGNAGTGVSPVHTYVQDDTYTVTLTVTDNAGVTASATTTATISDTEPVADFTATPTAGLEPLSVDFIGTSTSHDGITSWEWDFDNDGTVDSTEQNPANTYTGDGAYTVTLKVYETDGDSDTETKTDYITVTNVNQPPVADPNGPYTGTEGTEIAFDGSASSDPDGSIVSYNWDFGDGNSGTGVSPVHTYVQNGTYTVNLTVTDNDGVTDRVTTTATISDTEPVADFTATPTAGPEPLSVDFTGTSTSHDGITSWEWDFNNDSTVDSTEQNPTYTYTGDGAYTVTLKVYETDGDSDTETKTDYITVTNVNQAPVSDPNGPYTGAEGTEITFDGSASSDPDGSIVSYNWDFGDGNSGTGVSPVHTYVQNGTYTVNLTVTDNAGVTDRVTTTATISDTEPVADFTATPTAGPEPLSVDFTGTSTSHDGITSWEWDFNNDSTVDSTEQNPTYTYTGNGAYTVTLKVYETDGNSDTKTKIDYITVTNVNQAPVSDPNGPYTGAEGTEITFDGSASSDPDGSIVSYNWDFGDGNSGTGVSPVHTYVQNGTYTVNLTVTDNAGVTDRVTTTATISDTEPVADFTATPTAGPEPLSVDFTGTSTSHDGITSWEWDFNNDSTVDSTEQNPTYTYTGNGAYTVTLKVYETDGNSDTETKIDYITVTNVNQPPVADPNGPYTGAEGTEIAFDGSASSDPDGSIVSYDWDFGDGTSATGVSPVHTYVQNGTYTVNLTVTDNDGATDSGSTTATISDTEPVADFTATPTSGLVPLTVVFTGTSTSHDGITSWEWDFNNDSTVDSTEQNPTYTYTGDGAYTVTLKVYETDGNSDTETKIDYITVTNVNQPPVADPNGPYTGAEGTEIAFDGSASSDPDGSIVSYNWDFGDGTSGTGVSPGHTYVQDGTYIVNLTVTDNDGATDSGSTTVVVGNLVDTIAPTVIINQVTSPTNVSYQTISGTFTESGSGIDLITVNGVNAKISGTIYSVTIGLTEGTNPVDVIAIDNTGNSGSNSTTIVLDTTAPAVSITKPKAKHNMIKFVNNIVRGKVDDDNLNYAILIVKNNNDTIVNSYNLNIKSNKFTQRVQFAPDQNNTLELFAIDNAGNFNNINRTIYVETNIRRNDISTVYKSKPVEIDASNEIGTGIKFLSNVTVTNVTFIMTAITNQTWVEGLNDSVSVDDEIAVGKIVEINVNGDLDATNESHVQHVIVKLYYTMDDLDLDGDGTIEPGELDENNMFIYWLNTTSGNWIKLLKGNPDLDWVLDNGQVKISGNDPGYIWVKVKHLSTFGLVACPELEFSGDGNDQVVRYDSGSSAGVSRGSSGEAYDNIALNEFIRKYISVGTTTTYRFEKDENGIEYITFDAKTNAGYVVATIEVLEDTSALVSSAPSGKVYQHMNVLVGSSGYATERNIAYPVIGFKVARSWIAANNIDESKIRLNRYSDENWNPLATSLINEDADYLHFESVTPGFSPFAITAEEKKAETDGEGIVTEPAAGVEAAEATPEQALPDEMSEIPGFGLLSGLSVVLIAMQILRKTR